jgi:hypothetical protein
LIPLTSVRSSSIVKLIESAIAPVTSSVTDACTVRSPSARLPISFSRPQDRLLVALVLVLALESAHARVVEEDLAEQQQRAEREQREDDGEPQGHARLAAALVEVGELRRVREKRLGVVVHASCRLLRRHEPPMFCVTAATPASKALARLPSSASDARLSSPRPVAMRVGSTALEGRC